MDFYQIIHNDFLLQLMRNTTCSSCSDAWNGAVNKKKRRYIKKSIVVFSKLIRHFAIIISLFFPFKYRKIVFYAAIREFRMKNELDKYNFLVFFSTPKRCFVFSICFCLGLYCSLEFICTCGHTIKINTSKQCGKSKFTDVNVRSIIGMFIATEIFSYN